MSKRKWKIYLWVAVRTTNPRMPQLSFFFEEDMNKEDARLEAESYARQLGFEVSGLVFDYTGSFQTYDGLIK